MGCLCFFWCCTRPKKEPKKEANEGNQSMWAKNYSRGEWHKA